MTLGEMMQIGVPGQGSEEEEGTKEAELHWTRVVYVVENSTRPSHAV
jgi:hypothetical protein